MLLPGTVTGESQPYLRIDRAQSSWLALPTIGIECLIQGLKPEIYVLSVFCKGNMAPARGQARRSDESPARDEREGDKTGSSETVRLSRDLVSAVHEVAEEAETEPETFIRASVLSALRDDDADVEVSDLTYSRDIGEVTLSADALATAKGRAKGTGTDVGDYLRGAIRREVASVIQTGQMTREARQGWTPAPDPAGLLTRATGGNVRDPIRLVLLGR